MNTPDYYPDSDKCPPHVVESLTRYIKHGVPTGGFLEAVICNQLIESFLRADLGNLRAMPHIVAWVYNNMPIQAKGSADAYKAWLSMHAKARALHIG